ncbi:MAG: tetratricopeptide repeat protein [Bacteroidales bacterium]|jgi:tetratricopeptide (TPR) repeat protein|nr:tetratricopeptide repeat protein [Bacteroidales bacterium]
MKRTTKPQQGGIACKIVRHTGRPGLLVLFYLLLTLVIVQTSTAQNIAAQETKEEVFDTERSFDYYFQEGLRLKAQEEYGAAYEMFRHCLSLDSTSAAAHAEIAAFYRAMNQTERFVAHYEKAFALDPDNDWYGLQLAGIYQQLQRYPDAINLMEQLVVKNPDNYELYYTLSLLHTELKQYAQAIEALNRFENSIGINQELSMQKYNLYLALNQAKPAIRELQKLQKSNPQESRYHLLLGGGWMELGKTKKAKKSFLQALDMDPDNGAARLFLSDYYKAVGDSLAMNEQLHLALSNPKTELDSKLSIFRTQLSNYENREDSLLIEHYFELLLEQHPTAYDLRDLRVRWLLLTQRKNEAISELRNVLDLNPNQLRIWQDYLGLNLEEGNQEQIRRICQEALVYFPGEAEFWYYLALTYSIEQNHEEALNAYKQCLENADPNNRPFISNILGYMGDIYHQKDDTVRAYAHYEQALEFNPDNHLVLNNYAYFLSLDESDLSKAEKMSRRSLDFQPTNSTYLDTYAWVFFKQEQYRLAKIYIQRAIEHSKEPNVELLEHYGDILWFNNETEAAVEQWKNAAAMEGASDILQQKARQAMFLNKLSDN